MRWYIEGLSEIDDTNERFRLLTIWKKETGEGEEASEEMKERIRRKNKPHTYIPTASPICYTADLPYVSCEKRRREKEAGKGGKMSLTDPLFKKRRREREAGKGGRCLSLPIRPICHTPILPSERHLFQAPTHRLVAGATLFHFNRWVAASTGADGTVVPGGTRLLIRLAQALVLPGYRGEGHGSAMLRAAYAHARAHGALEVSVEDPSPKFRLLRDVTDLRTCVAHGLMRPPSTREPPSAAQFEAAGERSLATREQLTRCYEAQQWARLKADGNVEAEVMRAPT